MSAEYRIRRRTTQPAAQMPTPREIAVLELLADGLTAEAIARRLEISPRTVHRHLQHLYRKLGTTDRLVTVLRAQDLGLLHPCGPKGADNIGADED